ncbi:hypothetical protein, partial [Nocardia pseudovaccinii]|uniref:hypothetical protein n=1 Tax=Nocardia pseudovaccinii TaxID=189540 RepID=UPI000AE222A2
MTSQTQPETSWKTGELSPEPVRARAQGSGSNIVDSNALRSQLINSDHTAVSELAVRYRHIAAAAAGAVNPCQL